MTYVYILRIQLDLNVRLLTADVRAPRVYTQDQKIEPAAESHEDHLQNQLTQILNFCSNIKSNWSTHDDANMPSMSLTTQVRSSLMTLFEGTGGYNQLGNLSSAVYIDPVKISTIVNTGTFATNIFTPTQIIDILQQAADTSRVSMPAAPDTHFRFHFLTGDVLACAIDVFDQDAMTSPYQNADRWLLEIRHGAEA